MNKLVGVCWSITSDCNMNCPICCRYVETNVLSLDQKLKIIEIIRQNDVKKINIAGGEPLLDPNLLKLLEYSKSLGLKTALSTNSVLLSKSLMDRFLGILDEIQIPLDGSNADIHSIHRGSRRHFDIAINNIRSIVSYDYQLDVSTVVTSKNHNDLVNIGLLLKREGVDKWKLFHFNPVSIGRENMSTFNISENDFILSIDKVLERIKNLTIDYGLANAERLNSYFNISPSGNFYLYSDGYLADCGNILQKQNLNDLALETGFNYSFHKKRFWRDLEDV